MDANPAELIILQTLRSDSIMTSEVAPLTPPLSPGLSSKAARQYVLTLKYVFETRPTETNVRELGSDLNAVVINRKLNVNRIMWGGLVPRQNDAVFRAISRFRNNVHRSQARPTVSIAKKRFSSIKEANGSPKSPISSNMNMSTNDTVAYIPNSAKSGSHDTTLQHQLQEYRLKRYALMSRTIWAISFLVLLLSMVCCHRIYIFVAKDDKWSSWLRDAPFNT